MSKMSDEVRNMSDKDFVVYYKREMRTAKLIMLAFTGMGLLVMLCGIARLILGLTGIWQ